MTVLEAKILRFTNSLRDVRAVAKLSQAELASVLGVPRRTISTIERDGSKISKLVLLALVLTYLRMAYDNHELNVVVKTLELDNLAHMLMSPDVYKSAEEGV